MAQTTYRPLNSLPTTTLSWLTLRDHFVSTVGPNSGQGQPMGSLLVLADATFTAHSRFPLHPHQEMEILSIVLDGSLSHHGDQAHGATVPARPTQTYSSAVADAPNERRGLGSRLLLQAGHLVRGERLSLAEATGLLETVTVHATIAGRHLSKSIQL